MVFMGGFPGHNTYFARYSSAPVVSSPVSAPSSEDAISRTKGSQNKRLGSSFLVFLRLSGSFCDGNSYTTLVADSC